LSYEKSVLSETLFDSSNAPLVRLFNLLGSGVLRIGGNSVEKNFWVATGHGQTRKQISAADIDRLARFIRSTNWKVLYGINLANNSPTNAADEAAYVSHALGDRLQAFEIGNEPDLYVRWGLRPTGFGYEDFKKEWDSFADAIRQKVPHAALSGPGAASHLGDFAVSFARDESSKITLLTQHYYRASGKAPTSTIDLLLSPDPRLDSYLKTLSSSASEARLPEGYRVSECNSFYAGGAPGISNGFGTALWAIDFMFQNALNHSSGVNFHGGGDGPGYTPIADDEHGSVVEVRPEYYGMLMFALAANGKLLQVNVDHPQPKFSAYATGSNADGFRVILSNKDRHSPVSATISFPREVHSADSIALRAESLDATSGTSLGGATILADGSWHPATEVVPVARNQVKVIVHPSSAELIHAN
jgi:hypothetical protein